MAKIAIPAREFSEKSEKSLWFCTLIEKINLYIFVDILGHNYEDLHPEQEIQAISMHWNKYSVYIIAYVIFFSVQ